jgi:hypothetical protein
MFKRLWLAFFVWLLMWIWNFYFSSIVIPRSFSSVDWVMISPPIWYLALLGGPKCTCLHSTKLVKNIQHLSYSDRSRYLGLPSLQYRRLRSDMVETFRIINNIDKVNSNKIFPKSVVNMFLSMYLCVKLLFIIPSLWLAFFVWLLMWILNFNFSSIVIGNKTVWHPSANCTMGNLTCSRHATYLHTIYVKYREIRILSTI